MKIRGEVVKDIWELDWGLGGKFVGVKSRYFRFVYGMESSFVRWTI